MLEPGTRRDFLATSAALAASIPPQLSQARQKQPGIWARTILPQPFDREPFREVRVPAWVAGDDRRRLHALGDEHRRSHGRRRSIGVTISEMGFVDPFYAYYDSKLLKRRSPHVPLDRLEKDIAEYQKLGVRILGVYPPTLQGEVYETPSRLAADRHQHRPDPADRPEEVPARRDALPARAVRRLLHRRAGRDRHEVPDVDCVQLRRPALRRRVLLPALPRELPRPTPATRSRSANLKDAAFRRYQHWADRRMEDLIRGCRRG